MVRSLSESLISRRIEPSGGGRKPDEVVVEEPLSIRLDDVQVSSTMRTPGHDFELAAGFLHSEGALGDAPITGIRYCGTGAPIDSDFNVVSVETGGRAPTPTPRLGSISSSCGLCGSDAIADLTERLRVLPAYEPWSLSELVAFPERLRTGQALFDRTGGSHAAAAVTRDGSVVVAREDIGRHNAVDKVVGRLLLDGQLPAHDLAIVVSGRSSFEMVQKAWAAGFTALVAVSAPSSLAVSAARRAGLTLVAFARSGSANVYSPEHLVSGSA
ncbi:MAG: formate dehydrogenase accessory sulfurtransferase FdhD [Actinomycetota bacterium]